jgi:Mrp family chromosome partitioning ATPase
VLHVQGIELLRDHPTILFGQGDSAKSYLALWIAGTLAEQGLRVGLFDWELSGQRPPAQQR